MDIKEFILEERDRMQTLFDPFNEQGAFMVMDDIKLGLRDRCTVMRVIPQFDEKGEIDRMHFWLFHCAAGYHHDPNRYSHMMKVVDYWQEDGYMMDMVDEHGRRFHMELIMDVTEPGMVKSWKEWQAFKAENTQMFLKIDEGLHSNYNEVFKAE